VDLYLKVRLACAGGMSARAAAKHFNMSRDTVRKMLLYSEQPVIRSVDYQIRQVPIRLQLERYSP
jgi:hypothetical protein